MNQRNILYERVQEEYDQFLQELLQLDEEIIADQLHELILKTMILDLIIEEMYTESKMELLLIERFPLFILYNQVRDYI
ncbi:DUF3848 domain-containing protein [Turicibacter sanguinis]|uniref:DUF3848 domain-containing protein n=1 Tax=Turicibacter sanguinis TaxID=154288 RepID=UPI0032EC3170